MAEVQARDLRIHGLEEAISQLRAAQADRDAALTSIKETLKASQLELTRAGEDLGRLRDALRSREEEIAATQTSVEKHRSSLTLLQQNLVDKEVELSSMRADLEQARGQYREKDAALNEITASYKVQALELIAARGSLSGMGEGINRKEEELVTLHQQMDRMEIELRDAKQAFVSKAGDLVQAQDRVKQLSDALDLNAREMTKGAEEIQAKDATLAETLAAVNALQITLNSREKELGARQEEAREATESLASTKAELAVKEAALVETIALYEGAKADLAFRSEEAQQLREAQELLEGQKDQLIQLVQERDSDLVVQQTATARVASELKAKEEALQALGVRLAETEHARVGQMALAEQRSLDLDLKVEELAAFKRSTAEMENDIIALRVRFEKLRLDLVAQDAVVFGLREALARRDAEDDVKLAGAKAVKDAMAATEAESLRLRRTVDLLGSELCAARAALGGRDAELLVKQEALSESNDRYQAIFEQAGAGIARVGLDGRLLEANDKFYDLFGYTAQDLEGKTFRDITHRDDLAESALMYQQLVSGEVSSVSAMKRYVRKLGSTVWANVTMSSVRDAQGSPRYIMAIVDDRTDQMLAELALKEKEDRESEETLQERHRERAGRCLGPGHRRKDDLRQPAGRCYAWLCAGGSDGPAGI